MTMRHRGFTLLELLLAMTVLGVVMAMLGLALTSSIRVIEATAREEEVCFQAQTAMRRITEDLTAAISIRQVPFVGQNNSVHGRRADGLDFASQARLVLNPDKQKAGVARIRYQLTADQDDERTWKLLRSEALVLPQSEMAGATVTGDDGAEPAFLLADSVRALELRYYDQAGQELDSWRETWREAGESGQAGAIAPEQKNGREAGRREGEAQAERLPAAVQCTLEFWIDPDRESFQTFSTRILIPVEPDDGPGNGQRPPQG